MPIFDTSDIKSTGLTVTRQTILSGNSSNDILSVSGASGEILKITDNISNTLLSVATTGGTVQFSVTTGGTRLHTYVYDSTNSTGTTGQVLTTNGSGVIWSTVSSTGGTSSGGVRQISLVTNLASAGDTGTINQTHVGIGYSGTVTGWYLTCYPSATVSVDVWKVSNGVPTVANTITASAKPSTTAARFNSSTTLTGWSTAVNVGDYFMMNVDSNDSATYINLQLIISV